MVEQIFMAIVLGILTATAVLALDIFFDDSFVVSPRCARIVTGLAAGAVLYQISGLVSAAVMTGLLLIMHLFLALANLRDEQRSDLGLFTTS